MQNTFKRVLFIAPKMYYLEDINGKVTFKVKGVSTLNVNIGYERLLEYFKTNTPIKFTNQTQFTSVKDGNTFVGVKVDSLVSKRYKFMNSTKRI
jgi:hypothetical protein